ncbi:MAG: glycyl-radical enzyme activating protein [Chloroflexota bacterium]|nr:glycyl-radical enzyme activating protein [Chloroflexota bacterium]
MRAISLTGTTFNIQRFSTEDGPGIRTTLFFKGCPLRCAWCHNPEGISPRPELMWYDVRCIGAGDCLRVCPEDALELTSQGMRIDRARCTVCGDCAEACPSAALEIIGREWTPEALFAEVQKDAIFYETSDGGVTLSGGEPMAQADFILDLARLCRGAGIHVVLDTCGAASWARYEQALSLVDLVFFDLKIFDGKRHRSAAGADNAHILENARRIAAAGMPMWIRTPIIPGFTSDKANIAALGDFIAAELPTVERWDLLAYTNLGQAKYHRLERPYALEGAPLLTHTEMEALHAVAVQRVPVAVWSGATRDK